MCPVACLDGALLGVLTGRWLRFRGASAVVVVALIVVTPARSRSRSWRPAAPSGGSGCRGPSSTPATTRTAPRRSIAGNPAAYLGYLLALGALAVLGRDVARPHRPDAQVPHPRRGRRGGRAGVLRPRGHHRQPRQPGLRPDPVQGRRVERSALVPPARGRLAAAARGLRCSRSHRGPPRAVAGRRLPARAGAARLLCGRRGVRLRRGRPSGGGRDAARSGLAARQPARRDAGAAVGVGPGGGAATWRRPVLAAGLVAAGRRHRPAGRRLGGPGLPTTRPDARRAARAGGGVGRGGAGDARRDVQLGHPLPDRRLPRHRAHGVAGGGAQRRCWCVPWRSGPDCAPEDHSGSTVCGA